MGLVRFFGRQFALALVMLALLVLLMTGALAPLLDAAGTVAEGGALGLAAVALVGFLPVLAMLWFGLLKAEGLPGRHSRHSDTQDVEPSAPAGTSSQSRTDQAWEWAGLIVAAAVFLLTTGRSLASPAGWHSSAMHVLNGWDNTTAGTAELAAVAVMLGPLAAVILCLQLTAALTREGPQTAAPRRAWVWAAAGVAVLGALAGVFWLA